jgi:hypothetical protein
MVNSKQFIAVRIIMIALTFLINVAVIAGAVWLVVNVLQWLYILLKTV